MRTSLMALPAASLIALVSALGATEAQAGLETVTTPRDGDTNCQYSHESNPFALWRPSQGRFIVGGSGKAKIEVYGHGIDLSPSASLTGIRGASASRVDGRAGIVNGPRGCGNVGSIIVEINLPAVTSVNRGSLIIGGETIPFTATPVVAQNIMWDTANRADGRASSGGTAPASVSTPSQIMVGGSTGCGGATDAQGQCVGSGNSYQVLPSSSGGGRSPDQNTLSRCADALGLKGALSDSDTTLTLTLPVQRTGQMTTCLSRHLLTHYLLAGINDNFTMDGPAPTLAIAATNGLPVSIRQQSGLEDRYGLVSLNPTFLQNFVGRQSFDLTVSPGSATSKLKLVLVSEPSYGPKALSTPITLSTGRLSSNITLKVTTYQPALAGETFAWGVSSNDVAASTCFETVSGTLTTPVGGTQVDLPLTVKEAAACYSKSFKVSVTTASLAGQVSGSLFDKSSTFVLQPLNAPKLPSQTPAALTNLTRP